MGRPNHAVRYANLREKRTAFAERRKDEVLQEIKKIDRELDVHASILRGPLFIPDESRETTVRKIKTLQRSKEELLVELNRYQNIVLTETPERVDLLQEFYKIKSTPSITSISVKGETMCLIIESRLELDGYRYNLGDWILRLDLSFDVITTKQLRSGLLNEVKESGDNTSIQYSWSFGFCFGDNDELIRLLVYRGDYVAAIQTAVTYINDVNAEHKLFVPLMYKRVS